jgi:ABC-2 type transport system ATP-binding protein
MEPAIETRALEKVYPGPSKIRALDGLDLSIRPAEFFGLLGPNGAGKTTTIGILTTRVRPTGGSAHVAGIDVVANPVGVKQRIGVVPQRPNPDRQLTAIQNLLFHAAYFGIPRGQAEHRARALLDQFDLGARAGAGIEQLSGGQQQRLMIARALIHEPEILFLDEPTVGLDPQARLALWDILQGLHRQGRTIVMTTHYMEEADRLCDRVAIVDRGGLLALDTPASLKARAPGGTLMQVSFDRAALQALPAIGALPGVSRPSAHGEMLTLYVERAGESLPAILRVAQEAGLNPVDIRLTPPSLETLFVSLTGRQLE